MEQQAQSQLLVQLHLLETEYSRALELGFVCHEDLPYRIQNMRYRLNELEMYCFGRSMPTHPLSIYDYV